MTIAHFDYHQSVHDTAGRLLDRLVSDDEMFDLVCEISPTYREGVSKEFVCETDVEEELAHNDKMAELYNTVSEQVAIDVLLRAIAHLYETPKVRVLIEALDLLSNLYKDLLHDHVYEEERGIDTGVSKDDQLRTRTSINLADEMIAILGGNDERVT